MISSLKFYLFTNRMSNSKYTLITTKIIRKPFSALSGEQTIVSPWMNYLNNSLAYFRKSGDKVITSLKAKGTDETIHLKSEEISTVPYNTKETDELVLTKKYLDFPNNWSFLGDKKIQVQPDKNAYILYIYELSSSKYFPVNENQPCAKNNITHIYDVVFLDPTSHKAVSDCYNGGRHNQSTSTCECPPGFAGNQCEVTCGSNRFGQNCSVTCSDTGTECKGIVLCTPGYGCSCAPGYRGEYCVDSCEQHTYGAECNQTCPGCKHGCDLHTGNCLTPHAIPTSNAEKSENFKTYIWIANGIVFSIDMFLFGILSAFKYQVRILKRKKTPVIWTSSLTQMCDS